MSDDALTPTPNTCALPRRRSDFATFNEAIDYASRSEKGLNFHDMRGTLTHAYPFTEMREDALEAARRRGSPLRGRNLKFAVTSAWPAAPKPTSFTSSEADRGEAALRQSASVKRCFRRKGRSPRRA